MNGREERRLADVAIPFDPVARSQATENDCMRGAARRHHRFRAARYCGGIVTADAVGCSLLCAFCWNDARNADPGDCGSFYSPRQVETRMTSLARRSGFQLFRITGSEPVLGERSFAHALDAIEGVRRETPECRFVLETNGLMPGWRPDFAARIPTSGVAVRVALKGVDGESFQRVSGARGEFFDYPLQAILRLEERGVEVWPAVMEDLYTGEELKGLRRRMQAMGIRPRLETERLERYPAVIEHLRERGLAF